RPGAAMTTGSQSARASASPRGTPRPHRAPAISAHRGGRESAREGTYEAYRSALDLGADYVEFDVRRTRDGELVASHHGRSWGRAVTALGYDRLCELTGYPVPRVAGVVRMLAGRAGAHMDLKDAGSADAAIGSAVTALGPAALVVTTRDTRVARAVKHRFPAVPVGGHHRRGRRRGAQLRRTEAG